MGLFSIRLSGLFLSLLHNCRLGLGFGLLGLSDWLGDWFSCLLCFVFGDWLSLGLGFRGAGFLRLLLDWSLVLVNRCGKSVHLITLADF